MPILPTAPSSRNRELTGGARVAVLATLAAALAGTTAPAPAAANVKPLFDVGLDLENGFPEAEKTFGQVKKLILEHYYSDEIDEEALYYAAIEGMLRHVSPPDSPGLAKIWPPETYAGVRQSLEGVQVSIGVKSNFNANDGSLTVTEVLPESPAEGILQPFDRVLRVDGRPLRGLSVNEVNGLLKDQEGTQVTLTVNRDVKVFEVALTRRKFATRNLVVTRLSESIAMLEVKSFSLDISKQVRAEVDALVADGITSLVLDLRNNTGGVFAEALRTAEVFLAPKNIILRTFDREKKLQNYISSNEDPAACTIAILVNDKTASAAEIVAGCLRDHKVGFILGTRTYGKGVFEKTFTLENKFRVKFITGAMYTPVGKAWQGKGLVPDFLVDQEANVVSALLKLDPKVRAGKDVAIITATKLLNLRAAQGAAAARGEDEGAGSGDVPGADDDAGEDGESGS